MTKIKNIFLALFILGFLPSCEDFLDVNEDPNNPREVDKRLVLAPAISSTCYVVGGYYQLIGGFWSQHWTQSTGAGQWKDLDSYNITNSDYERQYREIYAGSLNDFEYIKKSAEKEKDWNYYLIATVGQAYTFQVFADLYNYLPFSEAFKGEEKLYKPKWENAQNVYDSLIVRIDNALTKDFDLSSNTLPTNKNDLLFKGSMKKWKQFANTLKLKLYMRQSYARPSVAEAGIKVLFTNPDFLEVDVKMTAFADGQNRRNPAYETFVDRLSNNVSASRTLLGFLQTKGDPRLDAIYNKNSSKEHFALTQGDYSASAPENIKGLSTPALTGLDPVYLMSKSEVYFLQAEAIVRYGVAGDAKLMYEAGVKESFKKFNLTEAQADLLLVTGGSYEFPTTGSLEDKVKAIITQKWIAMANSQGLEAFLEHNRTHYPDIFTISKNAVSTKFPKRLLFPASENNTNFNGSYPETADLFTKIWWDKK